jgi:hypothetical protein
MTISGEEQHAYFQALATTNTGADTRNHISRKMVILKLEQAVK